MMGSSSLFMLVHFHRCTGKVLISYFTPHQTGFSRIERSQFDVVFFAWKNIRGIELLLGAFT